MGSLSGEVRTEVLCGHICDLEAENAKLRDEVADLRKSLQTYENENARLKQDLESVGTAAYLYGRTDLADENAKLRELVTDMYQCSDPCNDCPHYNVSNSGYYCGLGIGWKARRMRELGIEVDG